MEIIPGFAKVFCNTLLVIEFSTGQSYGRRLGFGGMGSGQSFRNNILALQAIQLRMHIVEPHVEPDCSYNFFGRKLTMPVMGAPATGVTRHNFFIFFGFTL